MEDKVFNQLPLTAVGATRRLDPGRRVLARSSEEVLPMRGFVTQTIALRLRTRDEVATLLGEGLTDAPRAHRTSPETPGTGYVVAEDGSAIWVRAGLAGPTPNPHHSRQIQAPATNRRR